MKTQHQTAEDFAAVMVQLMKELDTGAVNLQSLVSEISDTVKTQNKNDPDRMLAIVQTLNDRIGNETTMDLEDNANHVYRAWLAGCHNVIREHGMKIQINRLMEGV